MDYKQKKPLGQYLLEKGVINKKELMLALEKQKQNYESNSYKGINYLGNILLAEKYVEEDALVEAYNLYLKEIVGIAKEYESVLDAKIDEEIEGLFTLICSIPKLEGVSIVPVAYIENVKIKFAIYGSLENSREELVKRTIREFLYSNSSKIFIEKNQLSLKGLDKIFEDNIEFVYGFEQAIEVRKNELLEKMQISSINQKNEAMITSVSNELQHIWAKAIKDKASDVEIFPMSDKIKIDFRINTVVYDKTKFFNLSPKIAENIVNVILTNAGKNERDFNVNGKIDISNKDLVGDGKYTGRISIVRTVSKNVRDKSNYRISCRIIDHTERLKKISELNLTKELEEYHKKSIKNDGGIILVCGHMGSGKNQTLYGCIGEIDTSKKNIMTVEDPVEKYIDSIPQVEVDSNLTFLECLKIMSRQDINVAMIGEIRDNETAKTVVRQGVSGLLLLSTLHAEFVAEVFARMKVLAPEVFEEFVVGLRGVTAQKLVRRVCPICKVKTNISEIKQMISEEDFDEIVDTMKFVEHKTGEKIKGSLYRARKYQIREEDEKIISIDGEPFDESKHKPCLVCKNTGYDMGLVISEYCELTPEFKKNIRDNLDSTTKVAEIVKNYMNENMTSFRFISLKRLLAGETTVEELCSKKLFMK